MSWYIDTIAKLQYSTYKELKKPGRLSANSEQNQLKTIYYQKGEKK